MAKSRFHVNTMTMEMGLGELAGTSGRRHSARQSDIATERHCGIDDTRDDTESVKFSETLEFTSKVIYTSQHLLNQETRTPNHPGQDQDVPTKDHHGGLWPPDLFVFRASMLAEALLQHASKQALSRFA